LRGKFLGRERLDAVEQNMVGNKDKVGSRDLSDWLAGHFEYSPCFDPLYPQLQAVARKQLALCW
jgi:hypothetical protein